MNNGSTNTTPTSTDKGGEKVARNNTTIALQVDEIAIGGHSRWTSEKAQVIRNIDEEKAKIVDNCATPGDYLEVVSAGKPKTVSIDQALSPEDAIIIEFLNKRGAKYRVAAVARKKAAAILANRPFGFEVPLKDELPTLTGLNPRVQDVLLALSEDEIALVRCFRDQNEYLQYFKGTTEVSPSEMTEKDRALMGYIQVRHRQRRDMEREGEGEGVVAN